MRGAEVRALLDRGPRARSATGRGASGILGFVPPELRDEQLAVLREVRPPVALIAGGRPSQAAPLEAEGVTTYLHVPSPGLLDRFLKDGARRFVFEGASAAATSGPRTSFALWELQIERLLAEHDLERRRGPLRRRHPRRPLGGDGRGDGRAARRAGRRASAC